MKIRNNEMYKLLCLCIVGLAIVWVIMITSSSQNNYAYACDEYSDVYDSDSNNSIIPLIDKDRSEPKYYIDSLADRVTRRTYIENAYYFLMNPLHAKNDTSKNKNGVCTTVAMQLLLGYHNYYSDRRLIPVSWRDYKFLEDGYGDLDYSPCNLSEKTPNLGSGYFGTADGLFDRLWDLNFTASWEIGQNLLNVTNVANNFIGIHAVDIQHRIDLKYEIGAMTNSQSIVLKELNANRPVVIGFQPNKETGANSYHVVVAYGHAYLDGQFGYIAHYGWEDDATHMWVPANWIKFVTTMVVNHTHNYEKFEAGSNGFTQNEYRCIECKHRCSDAMALKFEKTIHNTARVTGVNFPIQGTLVVPSTYNDLSVTLIDKSAFANQVELIDVTIPASIESIEIYAFENCTNLDYIEFKKNSQLYFIGGYAFRNCKLGGIEFPDTVVSIGYGAFEGCAELSYVKFGENSKLYEIAGRAFKNCKSLYSFNFPKGCNSIGPETFFGCGFYSLDLKYVSNIGERAFANCTKLRQVYAHKGMYLENYAFENCNRLMNINCINGSVYIESTALANCPEVTIYFSPTIKLKEPVTVPNVKNCTFNQELSYIESFVKSSSNPSNLRADNKELTLYREGYTFGGWYTNPEFTGDGYTDVTTAPNGTLYARWQQIDACVAKGTLITLADGRQVPVESLTGNEQLLVWNMWTGKFDSAPILFIDKDAADVYEVISLIFSDGTTVKVISEHAFWDFDLNRYVFLRNDAMKYIGHTFNKQSVDDSGNLVWNKVRLMDVNVTSEVTEAFSPVTYSHLCYYVNGMLSMPGATEGLINIFEVDKETMKFDSEKLAEDIDNYGLFTYEELAEILPVTEEVFYAFNAEYLKVAIGKGCIDIQTLANLLERYVDMMRGLGME